MRLLLYGELLSSPRYAEPRSATLKWEYRMWGALALDADTLEQEDCFREINHLLIRGVAPFDTVFQTGQGRGRKLVTEHSTPVGSVLSIV